MLPLPTPSPATPPKRKIDPTDLLRFHDAEEKGQPPLFPSLGHISRLAASYPSIPLNSSLNTALVRRAWNGRIIVDVFHPSVGPMNWAGKTVGIAIFIVRRPAEAKAIMKTPSVQLEGNDAVVAEVVTNRGITTLRSMGCEEAQ